MIGDDRDEENPKRFRGAAAANSAINHLRRRNRWIVGVFVASAAIFLLLGRGSGKYDPDPLKQSTESVVGADSDSETDHSTSNANDESDRSTPSKTPSIHLSYSYSTLPELVGPELSNIDTVKLRFQQARQAYIAQLRRDYGEEAYERIFFENGVSMGRVAYVSEGPSQARMVKRCIKKVLMVLQQASLSREAIPFVWATGGHSAAAGHGNIFAESYTAVMERHVQPILANIGIAFTGRNHAMGGTPSGPEIASCSKEVFGDDIDLLSWDYGMTDGRAYIDMELYNTRAGLNPSRPVLLAIHVDRKAGSGRLGVARTMEENGLTSLYLDAGKQEQVIANVPDTFGRTEEQIAAMPDFVRHFKCEGKVEGGEPGCAGDKWNLSVCPTRKAKTKWHPGWRYHALIGNLNAIFLLDMFEDAIDEITKRQIDPTKLFSEIQTEEDFDYQQFMQAITPDDAKTQFSIAEIEADDIDMSVIFKSPNYCHTARLPAEIRHRGILTESSKVGVYEFDHGVALKQVQDNPDVVGEGVMALVPTDRGECEIPPEEVLMDYKDYFYIDDKCGWRQLLLPNDAEVQEYSDGQVFPLKGFLAICFAACSWGRCPKGMVQPDNWTALSEIQVNGLAVSNMTQWQSCNFLRHEDGHRFPPNADGRFEIQTRVTQPSSFFKFSSFIVW
jgi:hypothetical protein